MKCIRKHIYDILRVKFNLQWQFANEELLYSGVSSAFPLLRFFCASCTMNFDAESAECVDFHKQSANKLLELMVLFKCTPWFAFESYRQYFWSKVKLKRQLTRHWLCFFSCVSVGHTSFHKFKKHFIHQENENWNSLRRAYLSCVRCWRTVTPSIIRRCKSKSSEIKTRSTFKSVFFNFISFCLNFLL